MDDEALRFFFASFAPLREISCAGEQSFTQRRQVAKARMLKLRHADRPLQT
jgi:hypothetical protein